MPKQYTLFGKLIPRVPQRRIPQLLGAVAIFALFTIFFLLPSSIPTGPSLSKFTESHRLSIPKIPSKLHSPSVLNPFRPAAHAPPVQANSTSGGSSWYTNWKWLSPFSSSVTLDENRSVLPPLLSRPPIYTYYDAKAQKDAKVRAAEDDLLLTWRRAWWAYGFRPIILGPAEAMKNPLYDSIQRLQLGPALNAEFLKWLAWESMGSGIMSTYLTLPMGSHENPILSSLRRGEYPQLVRYKDLKNGLFSGPKAQIAGVIKAAMAAPDLSKSKDLFDAIPEEMFEMDSFPESIAYYDLEIVKTKYPKVGEDLEASTAGGLKTLNQLINAHLHNTWQNIFSSGIAVLKPVRTHMTAIVEPALHFATFLAQCPNSPIQSSCPPNRPKCHPCVASMPLKVSTPPYFRNTSDLYTIGVVPHPWTITSLNSMNAEIDIPFIRRQADRDLWLTSMTKELLGTGISTAPRLVRFKEAVASPHGLAHSLWFTAEKDIPDDLDWRFGFVVPRNITGNGKSETPVPGPERRPKPPKPDPLDGPVPTEEDIQTERRLLDLAKRMGSTEAQQKLLAAMEAWSLADVEAWRFTRAFLARSTVERKKWEEEEARYSGGAGAERKAGNRWFDVL
jgi:hypothetical protein